MTSRPRRARRGAALRGAVTALVVGALATACTGGGSDDPTPTTARSSAASGTSTAPAVADRVTVSVAGGASRTWTAAELETLPRVTVTAADGTPVSGVPLPTIAGLSGSVVGPSTAPFVTYDVVGSAGTQLLTRAESDPKVGDHPALLTIIEGQRIDLVVPQDRTPARTLTGVTTVTVATVTPATALPSPGRDAVVVRAGGRDRTVSLGTLEQSGYTLRRPGGTVTQEEGARLSEVLTAAGVTVGADQLVTVAGPSGGAILTGGEVVSHLQEIGFSLTQDGRALRGPLFFLSGDVSGTRDVAGATTVVVYG